MQSGASACFSCGAGSYVEGSGHTACNLCGAGGYCDEVEATSASVFTPCEPGTWSSEVGLNASDGCIACGGKFQPISGAISSAAAARARAARPAPRRSLPVSRLRGRSLPGRRGRDIMQGVHAAQLVPTRQLRCHTVTWATSLD